MKDSVPYSAFSQLYDSLMSEVPYQLWVRTCLQVAACHINAPRLDILDIACGTGTAAILMAKAGHKVVGLDLSTDMLAVASSKADLHGNLRGNKPQFIQCDMLELDLPSRFDLATCFCDGFNHLSEGVELGRVLKRIRHSLRPGGVLVFDLNSRYKVEQVLGDNTYFEECSKGCCVMENSFDADSRTVDIKLSFFIKQSDSTYLRRDEVHREIWYSVDEVFGYLNEASLEVIGVWDGYEQSPITDTTERLVFAARCSK